MSEGCNHRAEGVGMRKWRMVTEKMMGAGMREEGQGEARGRETRVRGEVDAEMRSSLRSRMLSVDNRFQI